MESAVVAIGRHQQLERLAFDKPFARNIINDDMRKVGLARNRAN